MLPTLSKKIEDEIQKYRNGYLYEWASWWSGNFLELEFVQDSRAKEDIIEHLKIKMDQHPTITKIWIYQDAEIVDQHERPCQKCHYCK